MVVIADTSPVNYLILIGHAGVLPELYGEVVIPQAVLAELRHPDAPGAVTRWIASPPAWMVVNHATTLPPEIDSSLDPGEREAIALAQENRPDVLLLIDENRGREEAERHNIPTTGTACWTRRQGRDCWSFRECSKRYWGRTSTSVRKSSGDCWMATCGASSRGHKAVSALPAARPGATFATAGVAVDSGNLVEPPRAQRDRLQQFVAQFVGGVRSGILLRLAVAQPGGGGAQAVGQEDRHGAIEVGGELRVGCQLFEQHIAARGIERR